ncbi:ferritin-like domain-containing protein [Azospirillum thermophilum]|uniref:Rubrerythrin family protein n=1 Tax=Azospirillum thermophilum TaxID=2202148 RepID=A0A2S2CW30_9PROT|nr:ferritin family protein [Azospirillum thermophilum]AWK88679.1 rubrerythrin family protein [Azospirillum thermophilum]
MPLLHQEPQGSVDRLDELLGIALALEVEAVRRYRLLADLMDRRGEGEAAATFRALMAEEEDHVDAVDGWAQELGLAAPDAPAFVWRLPPDIAQSWEELTERTRLTPYQALSLAVLNEQRAFAFYSYISAGTADEAVRRHAESLAAEELRHAALLRRERRKAYRRERGELPQVVRPQSAAEFDRLAAGLLSAAAAEHAALAARLAALGDSQRADLLSRIAEEERALCRSPSAGNAAGSAGAFGVEQAMQAAFALSDRLAETFADVAAGAGDETVLGEALRLQETAVRHLSLMSSPRD